MKKETVSISTYDPELGGVIAGKVLFVTEEKFPDFPTAILRGIWDKSNGTTQKGVFIVPIPLDLYLKGINVEVDDVIALQEVPTHQDDSIKRFDAEIWCSNETSE